MSIRTEQIASTLRRAIQEVISRGLHDPRIRGLVSILGVDVAPDLSEAYVRVSVLPGEHGELTLHGLQHAARRIRADVGRTVRMRMIPRLVFRLDDSLKKQAALDAAIRDGNVAPQGDLDEGLTEG